MNILALDLSLTSTGMALPNGRATTIKVPADGMLRLVAIREHVFTHIEVFNVDLVVIEGYAMGTSRQSHSYAIGELGGAIRLALYERGRTYVEVSPASLKKYATGKGNASKDEVYGEAIRRLGYDGKSKDEADALWLRAAALDHYGQPVVQMPKINRDALAAVGWPHLAAAA